MTHSSDSNEICFLVTKTFLFGVGSEIRKKAIDEDGKPKRGEKNIF